MSRRNPAQTKTYREMKITKPRTYDYDKLAEEILEWAEQEDSINLCAFCVERGYLPGTLWDIQQKHEPFAQAYEFARMRLAERRERMLNADMLNAGSFHRYQAQYDPFLRKDETDEKDKDAARRKGIVESEQTNLVMLAQMAAEGKISQK